ncbi:haloalkane dehalogenase [Amycolatopsis sp. NPDC049253]|uniref:haloalkane dehalogenase n=1 Tax=Amycolatopsis sp. NPDC049253 TaxID=3155274 RepID=UPI00343F38AF
MPFTPVLGSTVYHRETGRGAPFVFLHGNPTSSYLWREVLPAVGGGRLLAPDLIGMGDSGKPPLAYTFDDHARHLDAWFDALGLGEIVLVGHDWGGALAFDFAARHPGRVRGVAFTETIVKPLTWAEFPAAGRELFRALKTPGVGERMVLDDNVFLRELLPGSVSRALAPADSQEYLRPYPTRESRLPLLQWPRAMPLDGEPAEVVARIERYGEWLAASADVPKLLVTFEPGPGVMLGPELRKWCTDTIAALDHAHHAVPAGHHTPEDQPAALAASISAWADARGLR